MKCEKCEEKAVVTKPSLCTAHFDEYILGTVKKTIQKYELFSKEDKICVAVSGGKDSLALLDILTRLGYEVEGLFINEGIANYREFSIEDLDAYIRRSGEKNPGSEIKVRRVSFEEVAGFSLDQAMATKQFHACTICGTLRRHLLNKYAKDYDVIATGHNLDDEAQTVLMNLSRGNTSLFLRTGPRTLPNEAFVPRVKPFYFVSEKHILTYTVLHKIKTDYSECPYAGNAYRMSVTEILNQYEENNPESKRRILETYLQLRERFTDSQGKLSFDEEVDHKTASDLPDQPSKAQQLIDQVRSII